MLWVADVTYLKSWEGWVYLAAVQDASSRRIVGHKDLAKLALAVEREVAEPTVAHEPKEAATLVTV